MARCTSDANDRWLEKFLVQGQPGPAAIENKKKENENAGDRDWELRKYVMQRSLRRSDVTLRASRDDHQLIN